MKQSNEETNVRELVLIRRRGGGEDAPHKGGVWKIAYADFMTAMMAFFLVMWLINSTDQRVLTQVANYFNPVRLTDSTPHTRGLNSIESGEQGKEGKQTSVGDPKEKHHANDSSRETNAERASTGKSDGTEPVAVAHTARYSEQALFSDPFGVLARIAAEAPPEFAAATPAQPPAHDSYRDPFKAGASREKGGLPVNRQAESRNSATPAINPPSATVETKRAEIEAQSALPPVTDEAGKTSVAGSAQQPSKAPPAQADTGSDEARKIEADIKRLASQLKGAVPSISVTIAEDGVLISVTDDYDFGMFSISSAEPSPALVAVMERIAKVVSGYSHPVTVRGHTDGRPYRHGTSDNWRLSTARAQMAYYMLVRGGVEEKRFDRIEGHADRSLRVPNDPDAAQNRRIEILLRSPRA